MYLRHYRLIAVSSITGLALAGCGGLTPREDSETVGDPAVVSTSADQTCLDAWSYVHFGSGFALGDQLGTEDFTPTSFLLVLWEIVEPSIWPGYAETPENIGCDLVFGSFGWLAHWVLDQE